VERKLSSSPVSAMSASRSRWRGRQRWRFVKFGMKVRETLAIVPGRRLDRDLTDEETKPRGPVESLGLSLEFVFREDLQYWSLFESILNLDE
jgi:hypothetical protein